MKLPIVNGKPLVQFQPLRPTDAAIKLFRNEFSYEWHPLPEDFADFPAQENEIAIIRITSLKIKA